MKKMKKVFVITLESPTQGCQVVGVCANRKSADHIIKEWEGSPIIQEGEFFLAEKYVVDKIE